MTPRILVIEARLTIEAFFDFFNKGTAYLQPRKMLVKFVLIILSHNFVEVFSIFPLILMPALFIRTSSLPNFFLIKFITSFH